MPRLLLLLRSLILFAGWSCVLLPAASTAAPIVWSATSGSSGTWLSFSKPTGADPQDPLFQDRITDNVWITRATTLGIYNARQESGYSPVSPLDTEWAWDLAGNNSGLSIQATNYANLTFRSWEAAHDMRAVRIVDIPGVLHLISDDIYLDIRITSWQSGGGGGFSYVRALPESEVGALLAFVALGVCVSRAGSRSSVAGS